MNCIADYSRNNVFRSRILDSFKSFLFHLKLQIDSSSDEGNLFVWLYFFTTFLWRLNSYPSAWCALRYELYQYRELRQISLSVEVLSYTSRLVFLLKFNTKP